MLFDLNGFKAYNDALDTPPATSCSDASADDLAAFARAHGSAYRLGGDEFCALLAADDLPLDSSRNRARRPLRENGEGFSVSAAHGAVLLPVETADAATALGSRTSGCMPENMARRSARRATSAAPCSRR